MGASTKISTGARAIAALLLTLPLLSCTQAQAADRSCYPNILADDMRLPHEGELVGVPKGYSWAKHPEVSMGNRPGKDGVPFRAAIPWGDIYEVVGNQATNTRVQIRNIRGHYLSKADGTWKLIGQSEQVKGSSFRADYKDNEAIDPDLRPESTGGVSVKLIHSKETPRNFHFWAEERGSIDPDDVAAAYASFEVRLVVDDPNQPDDRDVARFVAGSGLDYWQALDTRWNHFKNHGGAFAGRKRLIGKEWTTLTASTLTPEQLQSSPPPFRGEFCN